MELFNFSITVDVPAEYRRRKAYGLFCTLRGHASEISSPQPDKITCKLFGLTSDECNAYSSLVPGATFSVEPAG